MTPALPEVSADLFRQAMRRPANAVAVVATGAPGARFGVTLTAVCSLSDNPPSVLACLYRESAALEPLRRNGTFSVNFLAAGQSDLASVFAGRGGLKGEARFAPDAWTTLATGAPVLRGAVAAFDCHLDREIDSPTHAVLFGRVAALVMAEPPQVGAEPLTYSFGGFGSFVPLAG
ncbi:MAG: flavin reductase [Rhodobacter sp.]|nr:flavin reductase [Paracoccaceae bacterium]MCC0077037.1 flavin reductase [Rhodobacter sp.]